jgi:hypothetical protein
MTARKCDTYEEVAQHILNMCADEFGLDAFEGKQKLVGNCGTAWQIDGKGVRFWDGAIVVVECRRHTTSRQSQEKMAALAWRIDDLNAAFGIIVSPFDIQEGAKLVADAGRIERVTLTPDSTKESFCLGFLDKLKVVAGITMFICGAPPDPAP